MPLEMAPLALNQFRISGRWPAHAGDLLHGLDPGAQGGGAPGVQELAGPGGGLVGPQLLEVFLQ